MTSASKLSTLLSLIWLLHGCGERSEARVPLKPEAERQARERATGAQRPVANFPRTLEQGWDDETRESFWFTPQGSAVMPYSWFLGLEQAGSGELLRSNANMERYRYVPMPASRLNPDALPLGFVRDVDVQNGKASLGLTCAACHTAKLKLGKTEVIIDGGPTLADFKTFLHDLNASLADTQRDAAKFARFSKRVLGENADAEATARLREELSSQAAALSAREENDVTEVPYGYARLDAFGGILNNVAATGLGIRGNAAKPDAPVSYPFVWDAPHADRVQWNGSALNAPLIGGLVRNIGEVLGVFGRLKIAPQPGLLAFKGYENSVNLQNLGKLENWLRELWSPAWPNDLLPPIDDKLAQAGKQLYAQHCSSCHRSLDSRNPARKFQVKMVPVPEIGTDPTMAKNYLERKAKTGVLEGQRVMVVAGDRLGPETRTFQVVVNGVVGVLLHHPVQAVSVGLADLNHARQLAREGPQPTPPADDDLHALAELKRRLEGYAEQFKLFDASTFGYKARPLNGIWATAPYLHNGSVPSLWDLLQPASARPKKFHVGSREFDPKRVGLSTNPGGASSELDTSLHGNSNAGHAYGAELSDAQKWQLVEYLKTL